MRTHYDENLVVSRALAQIIEEQKPKGVFVFLELAEAAAVRNGLRVSIESPNPIQKKELVLRYASAGERSYEKLRVDHPTWVYWRPRVEGRTLKFLPYLSILGQGHPDIEGRFIDGLEITPVEVHLPEETIGVPSKLDIGFVYSDEIFAPHAAGREEVVCLASEARDLVRRIVAAYERLVG